MIQITEHEARIAREAIERFRRRDEEHLCITDPEWMALRDKLTAEIEKPRKASGYSAFV